MDKDFRQLIDNEHGLLSESYKHEKPILDLSIEAWQSIFTPNYFENLKAMAQLSIAYKAQADEAGYLVITSVMRKHYAQALSQLRFAVENFTISLSILCSPAPMYALFNDKSRKTNKNDEKLKEMAVKILNEYDADLSDEIKRLKDGLNEYGSHQSAGFLRGNFSSTDTGVTLNIFNQPNHQMTAGTLGILIEAQLLFHKAYAQVSTTSELLSVKLSASAQMQKTRIAIDQYKRDVKHLWPELDL
ncbi:hypothetical protein HJC99_03310 [Candidatus Saccharibacteria bacterium]|nr:hypothetical protein [Candidatus Saccharibacteria bacterium]